METRCQECKWAEIENSNYCYCKKKFTRVRLFGVKDCKKFTAKILTIKLN